MTQIDDIKMDIIHDRQERQPITQKKKFALSVIKFSRKIL